MAAEQHQYEVGDLVTFIEGETWVFIGRDGQELGGPPIGIVIGLEKAYNGIKVYWFASDTLTTEWNSQIQSLEDFIAAKGEQSVYW